MVAVKSQYSVPRRLESCIIQEPCPGYSQLSPKAEGEKTGSGPAASFPRGYNLILSHESIPKDQRDREKEPFVFPHVADKPFQSSKEIHK